MGGDVIRRRAIVRGAVQGVGFRANTRAVASRLALTGFVRNLRDGSVEAEVEGSPEAVHDMLEWLRAGPTWASVDRVEVSEMPAAGGQGFEIR